MGVNLRARFSLASLLVVTGLVAVLLAIVQFRPAPQVRVVFESNDVAKIDNMSFSQATLKSAIERERSRRKMWFQNSDVIVYLPESILVDDNLLLGNQRLKTLDELLNPALAASKTRTVRAWDVFDLLKKYELSDVDGIVIGGVNQGNEFQANAGKN